jgi:guanylate kinase
MSSRGRLFVISAPSGAGKTTLVRALMERDPNLRFSISYTTRPPRRGERAGEDYFFVDREQFQQMLDADAFLEHARVFGHCYGTARAQVEALLAAGHNVLLEIDWQGARQVRANMPDCCSIFIMPPSLGELERRLRSRSTDSADVIRRRLAEAAEDMSHRAEFDHVLVNAELEASITELQDIIRCASLNGSPQRKDSPWPE